VNCRDDDLDLFKSKRHRESKSLRIDCLEPSHLWIVNLMKLIETKVIIK